MKVLKDEIGVAEKIKKVVEENISVDSIIARNNENKKYHLI